MPVPDVRNRPTPLESAHGLFLHYQPIVTALTGRVVAVEALGRLPGPTGAVSAHDLFEVVLDTPEALALDLVVMRSALATGRSWRAAGVPMPIHVNLASSTMAAHGTADPRVWIDSLDIDPTLITLEITETQQVRDLPALARFVRECRAWGIEVALDDFGCGHSTLALLHEIEIDILKIDRRFISALTADPRACAIARHTISLAHEIGARVVAEGVETQEAWEWLVRANCDLLQGHAIARSMPAEDFVTWHAMWRA